MGIIIFGGFAEDVGEVDAARASVFASLTQHLAPVQICVSLLLPVEGDGATRAGLAAAASRWLAVGQTSVSVAADLAQLEYRLSTQLRLGEPGLAGGDLRGFGLGILSFEALGVEAEPLGVLTAASPVAAPLAFELVEPSPVIELTLRAKLKQLIRVRNPPILEFLARDVVLDSQVSEALAELGPDSVMLERDAVRDGQLAGADPLADILGQVEQAQPVRNCRLRAVHSRGDLGLLQPDQLV